MGLRCGPKIAHCNNTAATACHCDFFPHRLASGRSPYVTKATAESLPSRPEAIRIEDLHKRFGPLEVLRGVSLAAREGDVLSIIGASGSGKSTLLRCVNLLELPSRGRILISGEEVRLKPGREGNLAPVDHRQVERVRSPARHGVPEFQPLAAHDGPAERHRGAGPRAQGAQGRRRREGRGAAQPGRPLREEATSTRHSCPAASSSVPPSPGRLPSTPR